MITHAGTVSRKGYGEVTEGEPDFFMQCACSLSVANVE